MTDQNYIVKIKGTTDDVTICGCCGRNDLKETVVCEHEDGSVSFLGSVCAAKQYRWGRAAVAKDEKREIERIAKDADKARREAMDEAYRSHPKYQEAMAFEKAHTNVRFAEKKAIGYFEKHAALTAEAKAEVAKQFALTA